MRRVANVFNANEKGHDRRRDRREIKLETSNISPLGAVAILRAISIRDVVIEDERALSSLSRVFSIWERTSFFFFLIFFLSFFNDSSRRSRARAEIKAAIIEFPFLRQLFLSYRTEWINIISCTFNWSVCEKYQNFLTDEPSLKSRTWRWYRKIAIAAIR